MSNKLSRFFQIAILIITAVILLTALVWVPEWMANQYPFQNVEDWSSQVNSNRTAMLTLLGSAAVGVTVWFTARSYTVAQKTLRVNSERAATETFAKAVEQLGHSEMSVRLGGIHALGRIAKSSEKEYFPVMQILTGHVRHRYRLEEQSLSPATTLPGGSRCPVEVQSILDIVACRYFPDPEDYRLDLSGISIADAWVPNSDFEHVFFWSTVLTGWNFAGAKLASADFKKALLYGCDFTEADIRDANFDGARIVSPVGLTKMQLSTALNVPNELDNLT